jgi:hypothetical protein
MFSVRRKYHNTLVIKFYGLRVPLIKKLPVRPVVIDHMANGSFIFIVNIVNDNAKIRHN